MAVEYDEHQYRDQRNHLAYKVRIKTIDESLLALYALPAFGGIISFEVKSLQDDPLYGTEEQRNEAARDVIFERWYDTHTRIISGEVT